MKLESLAMEQTYKPTMAPPEAPATSNKGRPRQRKTTADSQIDRKRELDRIAQRMSRERSKNRITFLEQKLKSLEARDRDGQISYLMQVIEDLRRENTQLRASMMKIRFIADDLSEAPKKSLPPRFDRSKRLTDIFIDTIKTPIEEDGSQSTSSPQDHDLDTIHGPIPADVSLEMVPEIDESVDSLDSMTREQYGPPAGAALISNSYALPQHTKSRTPPTSHPHLQLSSRYQDYHASFISDMATFEATMASWSQPSFDWNLSNPTGPLPLAADYEKWNVSDSAFLQALEVCRTARNTENILDPDVPIKATLLGWHAVDPEQLRHPVWRAIRQVDERVFGGWTSKAQKMAMMYLCQLMMQYQASPTAENLEAVPVWFRPRASQARISHPLVVDFLLWPGLRDHLVFEHHKYALDPEFSRRFCEDLRFNWPFSDDDLFCFDSTTNHCRLSPRFKQYACNLKNWTMDARFFETFNEMAGNIYMSRDEDLAHFQSVPVGPMPMPHTAAGIPLGCRVQPV